jgi:hypothetical protein
VQNIFDSAFHHFSINHDSHFHISGSNILQFHFVTNADAGYWSRFVTFHCVFVILAKLEFRAALSNNMNGLAAKMTGDFTTKIGWSGKLLEFRVADKC